MVRALRSPPLAASAPPAAAQAPGRQAPQPRACLADRQLARRRHDVRQCRARRPRRPPGARRPLPRVQLPRRPVRGPRFLPPRRRGRAGGRHWFDNRGVTFPIAARLAGRNADLRMGQRPKPSAAAPSIASPRTAGSRSPIRPPAGRQLPRLRQPCADPLRTSLARAVARLARAGLSEPRRAASAALIASPVKRGGRHGSQEDRADRRRQ